jgi:REP element-mobilizing transposase RayT
MPAPRGPGSRALRKGRYSQPNGIYLVTAVTHQRVPWFQAFAYAQLMCRNLHDPAGLPGAQNLCWVVMPDHVHVLLQLGEAELDRVVRRLKARSALQLNRAIGRRGRFWAPGFHDHALRREENLKSVARYIVGNPLRARLVERVGDYPYWNAAWL